MKQLNLKHDAKDIKSLVTMVGLAKDMFKFFLPVDFVAPIAHIYWGGLYDFMQKWVRGLEKI